MDFVNLASVLEQLSQNISSECTVSLNSLLGDLLDKQEYAVNMVDAWGKPQSGLLYGSHDWLGSYDQCLKQHNATFSAQYYRVQARCFVSLF